MQLILDRPDYDYFMRGADGASALVNERTLTASFIVSPRSLIEAWPVRAIADVSMADLQPLLDLDPELLLLGSGATQGFAPPAVLAACLGQGIGLESMTNAAAARTFNVLASEGRRVVAGFIIR